MVKMPWLEVRPLQTAKVEAQALINQLNALHASGESFRFLIKYGESPTVEGRKTLQFFFEVNETLKPFVRNFLSSVIDAEIVEIEPPKKAFQYQISLELAQNPALPIAPSATTPESKDNPVDTIAQAMIRDECFLEVTAKRDDRAKFEIERYLLKKTVKGESFHQSFAEVFLGILGALASGQSTTRHRENYSQRKTLSPSLQALSDEARKKATSNLFLVSIRIYSNTPEDLKVIADSLPNYGLNSFKASKPKQNKKKMMRDEPHIGEIIEPSKPLVRPLLNHLWKIAPLAMVALSFWLGLFNPIHFLSSEPTFTDYSTLLLAASTSFVLGVAFRNHYPIILSSKELGLLVNLPSQLKKIPVQFGGTPSTRVGIASADQRFTRKSEDSEAGFCL